MKCTILSANVVFLFLLSSIGISADYYVNEFGSDFSGTGSIGNPWATVGYAVNQISDTEIIIYCSGTIDETPNGGQVVIPANPGDLIIDGQGSSIWKIQCDASASSENDITIRSFAEITPTSTGPSTYAIKVRYADVYIEDNSWIHGYNYGVYCNTDPDSSGGNSVIENNGTPGTAGNDVITDNTYGIYDEGWRALSINNCNIHHNSSSGYASFYPWVEADGNSVWSNGGDGFSAGASHGQVSITNCHIYSNGNNGINSCCEIFAASNNTIYSNNMYGIYATHADYYFGSPIVASNNVVYSNGSGGLRIIATTDPPTSNDVEISGNNVYNNSGVGIYAGTRYGRILIDNNTITGNSGIGMHLWESQDWFDVIHCTNNVITYNDSVGVYINTGNYAMNISLGTSINPGNNEIHDNDSSGNGYDLYNNSINEIVAFGNDWGDTTNALMTDHFYNTTDIPAIYDYWEDSSKGYVIWSESCPIITEPTSSTIWIHGETGYQVLWDNPADEKISQTDNPSPLAGDSLYIELYKNSTYVAELSVMILNTGCWTMTSPVPASWGVGSDFQVKITDNLNTFNWSDEFTLTPPTPIEEDEQPAASCYLLHNVVPNPSYGAAVVLFEIPEITNVYITVYNMSGRVVTEFMYSELTPGEHDLIIDDLYAGLYVVRMQAGNYIGCERMVVIR